MNASTSDDRTDDEPRRTGAGSARPDVSRDVTTGRAAQQAAVEQGMGRQNVRLRPGRRQSHAGTRGPLLAAAIGLTLLLLFLVLWVALT